MEPDVASIISETLHVRRSDLSNDIRIADLIQDSMDIVEFIAVLTGTYGLTMDTAQLAKMRTVGDVVRYVTVHVRREQRRERLKTF